MLKRNWLQSKLDLLSRLNIEQLTHSIEYRNEAEHVKLKPSKDNPKEVPYVKNNPREKDVNPDAAASTTEKPVP